MTAAVLAPKIVDAAKSVSPPSLPKGRAQRTVVVVAGLVLALSWVQDVARQRAPSGRPMIGAAFLGITLGIGAEFAPNAAEMLAWLILLAVVLSLDPKVYAGLTKLLSHGSQPRTPLDTMDSGPPKPQAPASRTPTPSIPTTPPIIGAP